MDLVCNKHLLTVVKWLASHALLIYYIRWNKANETKTVPLDMICFTALATITHCEAETLPGLFTQCRPGLAVGNLWQMRESQDEPKKGERKLFDMLSLSLTQPDTHTKTGTLRNPGRSVDKREGLNRDLRTRWFVAVSGWTGPRGALIWDGWSFSQLRSRPAQWIRAEVSRHEEWEQKAVSEFIDRPRNAGSVPRTYLWHDGIVLGCLVTHTCHCGVLWHRTAVQYL